MARILPWSSAVRVHDSQAYRKMDATRERIRCISELREMLPSFQTSFNLANVCAILESISGLEPLPVITAKGLVACDSICVDATGVVCHQLGLLGTNLHAVGFGGFAKALN